jgi:predicted GNAT family acetyltransferase
LAAASSRRRRPRHMGVTRFGTAGPFLEKAEAFLAAREVVNCMSLSIALRVREHPDYSPLPPYFSAVEVGSEVVAASVMTPPFRLSLALTDSPAALGLIAADVLDYDPALSGVSGPAPVSGQFAELWQSLTGAAINHFMAERIYRLLQVKPPAGVAGQARRAVATDSDLLIKWLNAFEREAFGTVLVGAAQRVQSYFGDPWRGVYLWTADRHTDRPVSMTAFGGYTPHGIRIGPVYTPPEFRGHGYASACVSRASQDLLDRGRQFCCLYTDLSNPTSNHIYQALGYEPVCDVDDYKFTPASKKAGGG